MLLDSIDRLRLQGINNYISLPQIIVCGDQSSGKSSLVLRRAPYASASVSIVPHESRPEVELKALRAFREELDNFADLPDLVERANAEVGITVHSGSFAKDILRIEVTGPDRPHLTIVDLPGLIHSETKNQTAADVELIQDVVQSYMSEPRCIILAVVSAKNDFANQVVLKLARAEDPSGTRTLGVITKPDTLVPGSESEALYVSLARNQEVEFRLGWHALKNMDSEKGSWDLSTRDAEELKFFSSEMWASLPLSSLGIDKLRGRLSKVLLGQIACELPGLVAEIEQKFKSCQDQLDILGDPRASPEEQRLYLLHLSQTFQALVRTSKGYEQRIRATIQNLNEDFASDISTRGHYRQIADVGTEAEADSDGTHRMIRITRGEFVDRIEHLMRRTRGRELPGTFNPMIVADLFLEQCRPWEEIAPRFIKLAAAHIADASTARALQQEVFEPAMNKILKDMRDKSRELLNQHQKSHPVTYNDDVIDTFQKMGRERKDPETMLCRWFRTLDCLNAYYKVALKRFVDDVAVEVVEAKLMSALDDILSPLLVYQMSADQVSRIAGESEETCMERERLNKQLVLRDGLETCKRFPGFNNNGDSVFVSTKQSHPETNPPHNGMRNGTVPPFLDEVLLNNPAPEYKEPGL
ncbi:P-loop containing nucleoside triphosphate hydrolase protein [Achaetomium macrosporum]|uniref:P-loop containing nucleoside triphosphate hydrolase protein n=1 Tax=Achaetomium macrosporum TaxID=79813 RepID=A0AAN7H6L3_9PEZI|nr:P-loop containing nucleoside triphosphate hydrolase protein [Achaetomium macrosporum]